MEDFKRKLSSIQAMDLSQTHVKKNKRIKIKHTQVQKATKTWIVVNPKYGILEKGKGIMQVEAEPRFEDATSSAMVDEVQLVDEHKTDAIDMGKDTAVGEKEKDNQEPSSAPCFDNAVRIKETQVVQADMLKEMNTQVGQNERNCEQNFDACRALMVELAF